MRWFKSKAEKDAEKREYAAHLANVKEVLFDYEFGANKKHLVWNDVKFIRASLKLSDDFEICELHDAERRRRAMDKIR